MGIIEQIKAVRSRLMKRIEEVEKPEGAGIELVEDAEIVDEFAKREGFDTSSSEQNLSMAASLIRENQLLKEQLEKEKGEPRRGRKKNSKDRKERSKSRRDQSVEQRSKRPSSRQVRESSSSMEED